MDGRPARGREFAHARVGLAGVVSKYIGEAGKRARAQGSRPKPRATPGAGREARACAGLAPEAAGDAGGRPGSARVRRARARGRGRARCGVKVPFRCRDQCSIREVSLPIWLHRMSTWSGDLVETIQDKQEAADADQGSGLRREDDALSC